MHISPSFALPPTPHFTFRRRASSARSPSLPTKPLTSVTCFPARPFLSMPTRSFCRAGSSVSTLLTYPSSYMKSGFVEYTTPSLFFQSLSAISGVYFCKYIHSIRIFADYGQQTFQYLEQGLCGSGLRRVGCDLPPYDRTYRFLLGLRRIHSIVIQTRSRAPAGKPGFPAHRPSFHPVQRGAGGSSRRECNERDLLRPDHILPLSDHSLSGEARCEKGGRRQLRSLLGHHHLRFRPGGRPCLLLLGHLLVLRSGRRGLCNVLTLHRRRILGDDQMV